MKLLPILLLLAPACASYPWHPSDVRIENKRCLQTSPPACLQVASVPWTGDDAEYIETIVHGVQASGATVDNVSRVPVALDTGGGTYGAVVSFRVPDQGKGVVVVFQLTVAHGGRGYMVGCFGSPRGNEEEMALNLVCSRQLAEFRLRGGV